jgi:RNA polymerase sigma factor (sigma-70 family)
LFDVTDRGDKVRTEDGHIIHKCLNGEPEAFGFLVDKYRESVYAFAYTKLRNFHDAEDVTQEVFIKAYEKLRSLRRWDSFLGWIYAITSNLCKNFIRARSRRPDGEFMEDKDPETLETLSLDSYLEDVARESLHESLQEALDSLPEVYSQVLALYYLGGMSNKEIARFLGTSPTAVKQRLMRARSQMREEMLAMMSRAYEQRRLPTGFTFHIVEAVKRIKIRPTPRMTGLPWGLSLATGIILTVLSLNPHMSLFNPMDALMDSALPSGVALTEVGEIPVDVLKISRMQFISGKHGNDSISGGTDLTKQRNVPALALRRDDGAMPQNPAAAPMMSPQADSLNVDLVGWEPSGRANFVYVADNRAYLCAGGTLVVLDVSDPANPAELGRINNPGGAIRVYAVGGYAYLTSLDPGLHVIDVSDPENPEEVGTYDTPGIATRVCVIGNYAYVTDGDAGLRVIDVSDPRNLREVGVCAGEAVGLHIAGDHAYVTAGFTGDAGVRVIDISDPKNPREVGAYSAPDSTYGSIYVSAGYAYVSYLRKKDGKYGVCVIDISNPENPQEVAAHDTPGPAKGIHVNAGYAHVVGWENFHIIDVSDPRSPQEVGFYRTTGNTNQVCVDGSHAYVADGAGLRVLDVSDPRSLKSWEFIIPQATRARFTLLAATLTWLLGSLVCML